MPFNENGDWVTMNPLEEYMDRVEKSRQQPGAGGVMWTNAARNEMHNRATRYYMQREGIEDTEENFMQTREKIGKLVESDYDESERNGFIKEQVPQEIVPKGIYRRSGD